MRRQIFSLIILLAMPVLAFGIAPVPLSGSDGLTMLRNLTDASLNTTFNASTNVTLNISSNNSLSTLANLTQTNSNGTNNTGSGLWSWGGKPRAPPAPPSYADVQYIQVIKENRME